MHKRSDREITARRLEAERLAVKARERENFGQFIVSFLYNVYECQYFFMNLLYF